MSNKPSSVAAKRKRKREQDEALKRTNTNIDRFFSPKANLVSTYRLSRFSSTRHFSSEPPSKASSPSSNDLPIQMENPFVKEKQQCILCKFNIKPDYKNTKLLSQFVSPYTGRIYGRHITRLCKHKQEQLSKEIVKAQHAGFMPYYNKEPIFLEDPKLFNPEKPLRNHDF